MPTPKEQAIFDSLLAANPDLDVDYLIGLLVDAIDDDQAIVDLIESTTHSRKDELIEALDIFS